jgi:hypothetical protein
LFFLEEFMRASPTNGTEVATMKIPARLHMVLTALLSAKEHAGLVGADLWDFAEEIAVLRAAGATNGDLRFLLTQKLIVHAEEVTAAKANRRKFRTIGKLSLPDRACFVLTSHGEELVRSIAPVNGIEHAGNGKARKRTLKPKWFSDQRELWLGNTLVKRFRRPIP